MFLVKHISLSGHEDLYQTPTIRYAPRCSTDPATLWIQPVGVAQPPALGIQIGAPSAHYPLTGGTVFVMNENGKTVARYDLGASMIPLEADPNQTSFAEFSRDKDGGLAAEAVDTVDTLRGERDRQLNAERTAAE